MRQATQSRELVTVVSGDLRVRGTLHRIQGPAFGGGLPSHESTGVVFVNPGALPRAAFGDSAVYWADSFAKAGYPSFRFDLPGLGDSHGDLPADMVDFVRLVDGGQFTMAVTPTLKALVDRFGFKDLILMGHCAGSVTALYAAAASDLVRGLVLLDPYFHVQPQPASAPKPSPWSLRNMFGSSKTTTDESVRESWEEGLPKNANLALIRCWRRLATARVPMLILTAGNSRPKSGTFGYMEYLEAAAPGGLVTVKSIDGTSHAFADRAGRDLVRRHVETWLDGCFPLATGVAFQGAVRD